MMKAILAGLLSLLSLGVRAEVEPATVARDYNHFGFELLAHARRQLDQTNYFLSPPGAAFALSMVANGAKGETLSQMTATLEVKDLSMMDLNTANKALLDLLTSQDPKLKLEIANGLWTDKSAVIEPEFAAANKSSYNAEVFSADFKDPSFVKTINDWVSAQTDGKIPQIVQAPLDPMLRLIVLDAIYFKGSWVEPFDAKQTRDLPFTLSGGEVVQHSRMVRTGHFRYLEDEKFQAVELPYAGRDISMFVILPKAGLDEFLRTFTAEDFAQWMRRMESRPGTIGLPRFKLENEYDLKPVLEAMGMTAAFSGEADFSGMASERLDISWVKQKTYVDVNEEGTEAAAVTGIGIRAMVVQREPPPFDMVVDKPFFLAITERKTGLILFLGAIFDPR
ncbi:MAG TPA: serpin family protein [Verrucomicrobiae bacterium]|jgi:serpin B|nr:serpin family protein [Verrucomicrobiae bacterium]